MSEKNHLPNKTNELWEHRNGDAWRTTNNRTTCIRMGALCYRVYCAEMVAIELLYTHEKLLIIGNMFSL